MRICHVVYAYYPSDPRVRREVDALRHAGYDIDVIALKDVGQLVREELDGVRIHRVPLNAKRGGRLRYLFQYTLFFLLSSSLLLLLQLRRRFRVVHVHSLPDFQVFGAWPLKLFGCSVVLDLHEALPEIVAARFHLTVQDPLVRIAQTAEGMSIAAADRVITVNDTIRNLLVARINRDVPIEVVMNSPDEKTLKVGDWRELRSRLQLGEHTIVYVGGINPERDLATLIRAVYHLKDRISFNVIIAGYSNPTYLESLKKIVTQLGLTASISFLPTVPQDEVLTYLTLSDIGVISYEDNPLTQIAIPTKVFEYAAAEKPMAMANLKGLRELFEGAADFFPPGDSLALASAIERLMTDATRSATYVKRATEILAQNSWDNMRARLLQVYSGLGGETR